MTGRTKPASLEGSGLLAVKGTAKPPEAVLLRSEPEPVPESEVNGAPLNFRVSTSFRREFRMFAAANDLKLNELLRLAFEAYRDRKV